MNQSKQLLERAKKRIPGGVNSPVRAFNAVEGTLRLSKEHKVVGCMMKMIIGIWILSDHGDL